MRFLTFLAIIALIVPGASIAQAAQSLSPDQVEKFVSSMDDVQVLSDAMKKDGKNEVIGKKIGEPKEGDEFTPYSRAVDVLKTEFPVDYKELGEVVAKHGFKSQEEWATTGDNVMAAYISSKIDPEAEKKMAAAQAQMTPEMVAKMPPEAVARMKQGMAMMATLKKVPAENREAVAAHKEKLEAFMNKEMAENKAEAKTAAPAAQDAAPAAPAKDAPKQ